MKVFLDMDGVLVDFVSGCLKIFDLSLDKIEWPSGDWYVHKYIPNWNWNKLDEEFWINLEWMPDGKEILSLIENKFKVENIAICTSPTLNDGCCPGKIKWLNKNLIRYRKQFIITSVKEMLAGQDKLLIDDNETNIDKFIKAGGNGILIPRRWNKLHEMANEPLAYLEKELQ